MQDEYRRINEKINKIKDYLVEIEKHVELIYTKSQAEILQLEEDAKDLKSDLSYNEADYNEKLGDLNDKIEELERENKELKEKIEELEEDNKK